MPATINNLQHDLFAKFRIVKTRVEWKKELEKCKYIWGSNKLPMINKFQLYCGKLQWPLPVQIEMRYNNSNCFSPARSYNQDCYPNQHQNRPFQDRYQCDYNNDNGYDWNQGFQCVRKSQFCNKQQFNRNNQTRQIYSIIRHHSMGMIDIWVIQTITLLIPYLMCPVLWHVMVLPLMLEEIRVFQMPAQ